MRLPFHLVGMALVLLLAIGQSVRAEPLWRYDWTPKQATLYADGSTTAGIRLTDEAAQTARGSNPVVATGLSYFTDFAGAHTFTNAAFSLDLDLKDMASGEHTHLNFSGEFNGLVSPPSQVPSPFSLMYSSPVTQSATLGGNLYTVTIEGLGAPIHPGEFLGLAAVVRVQSVPAPSTLALCGMGLVSLACRALRKRRRPGSSAGCADR